MAGGESANIFRDAHGRIYKVTVPDLSADYAPVTGSTEYETQTHAAATYETISGAAATYATQASVATFLNPPRCYIYQSAVHDSLPSGAWTQLTWTEAEAYDTDTMHDTVTNPGRITATTAGLYTAKFTLSWSSGTTGVRGVMIRKNSAGSVSGGSLVGEVLSNATPSGTVLQCTGEVELAAGDYFEFWSYQNFGSTLNSNVCIASARWTAPLH